MLPRSYGDTNFIGKKDLISPSLNFTLTISPPSLIGINSVVCCEILLEITTRPNKKLEVTVFVCLKKVIGVFIMWGLTTSAQV